MLSDSPKALAYSDPETKIYRLTFYRFRLPQLPTKVNTKPLKAVSEFKDRNNESPELPTINNAFGTSKNRYIYSVTDTDRSTFFNGLIKHNA
jgi:torulene dioxygenase